MSSYLIWAGALSARFHFFKMQSRRLILVEFLFPRRSRQLVVYSNCPEFIQVLKWLSLDKEGACWVAPESKIHEDAAPSCLASLVWLGESKTCNKSKTSVGNKIDRCYSLLFLHFPLPFFISLPLGTCFSMMYCYKVEYGKRQERRRHW
jgi:hypothetical protein